jgi:hypothetical protein
MRCIVKNNGATRGGWWLWFGFKRFDFLRISESSTSCRCAMADELF